MKTAIYDKNGCKIAGDTELKENLPPNVLSAELPLNENGMLYSRLSDGTISLIAADERMLDAFSANTSTHLTKNGFVKMLLSGNVGNDIKGLCRRYSFRFEEVRRVLIAEVDGDVSEYVSLLGSSDSDEMTVIGLDGHSLAVVYTENENAEMADAVGATFAEMNTDYNIGVSCAAENASKLDEAFSQALTAVRIGKKLSYSGGIWQFSDILPELVVSYLPPNALSELKQKAEQIKKSLDPETVELALAFFDHNLNISETARYCYLHRNTLIYRLDRIQKETGLNMRSFDDAVAFRLYIAVNKLSK